MESEVKGEARTPEIHIVPGLPQEESIFHNMQYNHDPDSDRRRRLSLENLPGLYNMSCTQLLAQVHAIGTNSSASTPSYAADSQISKDSWANSWKMESNPWILTPGSSHGTQKTGIVGEGTMEKPQYEEPHDPIDKSFHETGSPAGEKERKRGRDESDDDIAPLETPQPRQKRKKIRGKVAGDVNTSKSASKSAVKKASATAPSAKTSQVNTYVRPKRSCKRSLTFNSEEDGYSGLTFISEDRIGISEDRIVQDATMRIFGNIPRRKRKTKTRSKEQTLEEDPKGRNMRTDDQTLTGKKSLDISQNKFWLRLSNIQRKRRSILVQRRRHRQLKDIVSKMQSGVSRNKRSNRDPIASKLNARVLHLQWRRHNSTGTSLEELWEQRFSIDSIIKLFNELDVTRESPCFPQNRETTLVLHQKKYQKQKAAVQYKSDGSIIPYPDEKNHQTKVELDDETMRVWKLLMLSIDSEGIDGLEEDKQKWWEEERNLFHKRANLFIARMRLVQGDRRFSHWKGSIVDSVVGVFLTQNVGDHSSSSAFMDIAAEFPVISKSNKETYHEEWGSSITDEIVMDLDPGNAAVTPRIGNPTIFVDEIDDDDDIDVVCSQETSTSSDKSISSTNHSKTVLLDLLTNIFNANFDDFRNNVDEGTRVEHMGGHQQQKPNTKTDQHDMKNRKKPSTLSPKSRLAKNKPKESFDWDSLRRQAEIGGQKRQRTERTMDTVDWDALRCTNVNKIADIIRRRGMNNMLSQRIKAFLNRLVQDHEEIDLEWLRDVPPDKAKEYLMSINGLGLKSAECVRLLSLHQIAFPVDTNVGRIAVRLGWVPLKPLPDELQMHLLELYPVLESVQKYLWPRLCKLDQKTLYELHYHMITFGKVFCTKVKPNCEACPMKAECRHYASARASALRALPEPEESGTVTIHQRRSNPNPVIVNFQQSLFLAQDKEQEESKRSQGCEPIIEEPATPEIVCADIEDFPDPWENKDSIPTIILNKEANITKDLVVLSPQVASITRPKLKFIEKLRTEHYVYELPDTHHILEGFEKRELEDRVPYLLAIWTSGETASSIQPPNLRCASKESNILCHEKTCFSCNNIREENSQIVRGTVLIPCRTAMRGGFPLNGTYFQTNEVFADHGSSINPIDVPRSSIGGLRRRIVYFGSSVSACFGGLSVEAIQYGFWTGYVCVRGFDRKSRKPNALVKRLHCPPSKKKKDDYWDLSE